MKNSPAETPWKFDAKGTPVFLGFKELIERKGLVFMLVKRDFISFYKQTILGPTWIILQPLFSSLFLGFIFGSVAGLGQSRISGSTYYLSGFILWGFFADTISKTASLFRDNANLFGKVYFPRLIIPIGIVGSALIRLSIQLIFFFILSLIFSINVQTIYLSSKLFLLPVAVLFLIMISLGFGLIVAALTTRYRDLSLIINFGLQLLLFTTTVLYSFDQLPYPFNLIVKYNPISVSVDLFRLGLGEDFKFEVNRIILTFIFTLISLFIGLMFFNKVEKNFIDTI